ncbi:hypothetical protein [Sulfurimonas hydrogeniphila]|uniref:hypothetical protein n=1 Tax=Sulfurimonas TaxID=202746 RepID=UPI00165F3C92|nr:hypothetical protein [Sulfurimonas hydrogeniphila]
MITITVTDKTAEAINILNDRYYFGLFEHLTANSEEEYLFRDAIEKIAKSIQEEKRK